MTRACAPEAEVRRGPCAELAALTLDVARVLLHLPLAEVLRRGMGPERAIGLARALGRRRRPRTPHERRVLRSVVSALDRKVPGSNCYRRVLVESALDPGAARERVHFGLDRGAGPGSGHAWLDSDTSQAKQYEAVFSI
jgi:hypothetical protein